MADVKDASSRQLRSKLTLLGRRIDELEETTKSLHRTEDELMDIQDKIMQAEGSNCSLLAEVDTLRKRMLTIEGKDEEIRKAEGMCRNLKEKLEAEGKLSKDLKRKIEKLQERMSDLERLEEAFNRSKSDCTQLCLSLNEEKNLTRKLTTELEVLRTRVNELEASESRLDGSERSVIEELEKLKSLAVVLADERKTAGNKLKRNEEEPEGRTEKLEPNNKLPATDQSRNSSNLRGNTNEKTGSYTGDLWIEENVSPGLTKRGFNPLKVTGNYGPRNKTVPDQGQEDNKVKDLTQEIEKMRKRLKLLETVEEDLRKTKGNYNEMQERLLSEQNKAKDLAEQVDDLKLQAAARGRGPGLENGEPGFQDTRGGRVRQERPKSRGQPAEREKERAKNRDLLLLEDGVGVRGSRRPLSPSAGRRLQRSSSNPRALEEEKPGGGGGGGGRGLGSGQRELEKPKKPRDQPSVLSRYPPAANEPGPGVKRPWGSQAKQSDPGLKYRPEPGTDRPKRPPSSCWLGNSQPDTGGYGKDSGEEWPAGNVVPRLLNGTASSAARPQSGSRYRQQQRPVSPSQQPAHPGWAEGEDAVSAKAAEKETAEMEEEEEEEEEEGESSSPRQNQYPSPGPSYARRAHREAATEYRAVRCYMEDEELPDEGAGETRVLQAELVATVSAAEEEEEEEEVDEEAVMAEEAVVVSAEWRPFSPGSGSGPGSGPALRRVCSPRESLRSRAVIQPAIVAIDKKQMMSTVTGPEAEPGPGFGLRRPRGRAERVEGEAGGRSARRAIVTSSICIPPTELPRQRVRETHTSTGSITITPAPGPAALSEGLGLEYEIAIPRSDITMKPPDSDSDEEEAQRAAEEEEEEEEGETEAEIEPVFEASARRSSDGNGGSSWLSRRGADPEWRSQGLGLDLERSAWRTSRAAREAKTNSALDFSRVTARRAVHQPPASGSEGPELGLGPGPGGFTSRRFNNFADSAEVRGRPQAVSDDIAVSRLSALESVGRRNQRTTVAAKVADYNNSCSLSGQDGSDTFTAHNANVLLKKKELEKHYLSDYSIERLTRNETAGKRQSVKVELRKNALGNTWHQPGITRSEDKAPVGILSQIRMSSRR